MAWLFLLCSLLACLLVVALSSGYYQRTLHFVQAYPPPGLSEEDQTRIAHAIADSLSGKNDALSLRIEVDGQQREAFQPHEIAHMADVARLLALARRVLWGAGAALLALAGWSWRSLRRGGDSARIAKGMLIGMLDGAVFIALIAVWAIADFRSIFWFFHQIAFTNDLWLLDPDTDLLIRLMPQRFFEGTILRIAELWGLCIAGWCTAALLWHRAQRRHQAIEASPQAKKEE